MSRRLIIEPAAERELDVAIAWYEAQSCGLGQRFLARVDQALQSISEFPEMHPLVESPFRMALVSRFPYAIVFGIADTEIRVYSVFHCSQDPARWEEPFR